MRTLTLVMVLLIGGEFTINAVPLSVDVASNVIEDNVDDVQIDDFTTHGLERLSSAATCLVAGVEYTHGQQIYRIDPCEFCLCLDGEMFCWWQDCPPAMEGPCKDRGPFTPCLNVVATQTSTTTKTAAGQETSSATFADTTNTSENFTDISTNTEDGDSATETTESSTTQDPKHCSIMGRNYQIGDKLPHDTGNCVECVCGQGAKVTCSPHQCAPAGEDINDYRPPGPRQQLPDVF